MRRRLLYLVIEIEDVVTMKACDACVENDGRRDLSGGVRVVYTSKENKWNGGESRGEMCPMSEMIGRV